MNIMDSLSEQLRGLSRRVAELEKSTSTILKTLNERERSQKPLEKKWSDFCRALDSLKEQSNAGDQDLRSLKEKLYRLDGRVEEISRTVQGFKGGHNLKHKGGQEKHVPQSSNGPKITIRKHVTVEDGKSVNSSKAPSIGRPNATSMEEHITEKHTSEPQSCESIEKHTSGIPKPPVKADRLGLRGRKISFDVDNRVRLISGSGIEKGQVTTDMTATPKHDVTSRTEDKFNLPTREELQKKQKGRTPKETGAGPKPSAQRTTGSKNEYKNLAGFSKDPEAVPDIREMNTWRSMAEAERIRGLMTTNLKRGKGPNTCLLLDISGSMEGELFEEMMTAVKFFIKSLAEISELLGINENVGIATFGEHTAVVQHMTNDYNRLLEALDLLTPDGPSPMSAGLYMALACCVGLDDNTTIADVPVRSRIILISDGKGTPDMIASGEDDLSIKLETNVMKHLWLNEVTSDLERRKLRVYCVSLRQSDTDMMEQICKKTHGKMYKSTEMDKLIRMTQNTIQAIDMIDKGIDFENNDLSWMKMLGLDLETNPMLSGLGLQVGRDFDEVAHLGKYFSSINTSSNSHRELKETELPPLGVRVRRGPDWKWGDQDKNGPGTVVGHDGEKCVWVEWDCGHKNSYRYDAHTGYDILVVDEPRVLKGELIAVGCLVERGGNWRHGDQDGGTGNIGVVLNVNQNGTVVVRWPNLEKKEYKFGCDGFFEVKLCDPTKTHVWGSGSALGGAEAMPSEVASTSTSPVSLKSTPLSDDPKSKEILIQHENKDEHRDVKKVMTVEELNRRNNQSGRPERTTKTSEAVKMEDQLTSIRQKKSFASGVQWTYKMDGSWCKFPENVNVKMEKAYGRNKKGSIIVELEGHVWQASFSDKKMKRDKPLTTMEIQRNEITT